MKIIFVFAALCLAAVVASDCNSTTLHTNFGVSAPVTTLTFFNVAVPVASLKSAGLKIDFSVYCNHTVYLGYDALTCPNATNNDGVLALYPIINGTNLIDYNLASSDASVLNMGVVLADSTCNINHTSVIFNLMVMCPQVNGNSICPGQSICSNNGCGCLNLWYGEGCNVTGQCDPNGKPNPCGIDNGIGLGYQQCEFTDQYQNTTVWGECILAECVPGYYPLNNTCAKLTCDNTTTCNGNGYCNLLNNKCVCNAPYFGDYCDLSGCNSTRYTAPISTMGSDNDYFNLIVPTTTLKADGLEIVFSSACSYKVYVGYNSFVCPNSTTYDRMITLGNGGTTTVHFNQTVASIVNFNLVLNQDNCNNTAVALNLNVNCPAACPGQSICSNGGCGCFTNWWGMGCNVEGVCDPFSGVNTTCGIEHGVGFQQCVFADKYQNTSMYSGCVPAFCQKDYELVDGACKEHGKNDSKETFWHKNRWAIIFGSIGGVVGLIVIIVVAKRMTKRHHHYSPL